MATDRERFTRRMLSSLVAIRQRTCDHQIRAIRFSPPFIDYKHSTGKMTLMLLDLNWQVENLRFTWFGTQGFEPADVLWKELSEEPAAEESKQAGGAVVQCSSPFGGGTLVITSQPARIDVQLVAAPKPYALRLPLTMEGLGENIEALRPIVRKFLQKDRSPVRLAWGAVLVNFVDSRELAFETFARVVPALAGLTHEAHDVLFQVNRHRKLPLDSRTIPVNRLCKWQALSSSMMFQFAGAVQPVPGFAGDHFIRVEIDINTDHNLRPLLTANEAREIEPHLLEMALEISRNGDVE